MRYMGSKSRLAKDILPIILKNKLPGSLYVEPFVGGANLFHLVESPKLGNDINIYVVAMLSAVANGWEPPSEVSEEKYRYVKANKDEDMAMTGFVGFGCSFGGRFFEGYARDGKVSKTGKKQNYALSSRNSLLKQAHGLRGAMLSSVPYWDMQIPDGSTVYCDPPYRGTKKYRDSFDSDKFWTWAADLSNRCEVFVSEYSAPEGWDMIFEKKLNALMNRSSENKSTEKLFRRDKK